MAEKNLRYSVILVSDSVLFSCSTSIRHQNTDIPFNTPITFMVSLYDTHTRTQRDETHFRAGEGKWHVKMPSDEHKCVSRKGEGKKKAEEITPAWGWKAREAWRGSGWERSKILFQQPEGATASGFFSAPSVKAFLARGEGTCEFEQMRRQTRIEMKRARTTRNLFSGLHYVVK